jgi:segregation and condensation protein B
MPGDVPDDRVDGASDDQVDAVNEADGAARADEPTAIDVDAFPSGARGALEAVLMVVEEPVTELALASTLQLPPPQVSSLLAELKDDYDRAGRGFELREVAGGWRMFSRAEYAPVVERFVIDGQQARLTQASLETLAVVAYRQPVSRSRVSAVRGVNVDGVMRTLVTRGLVEERGTDGESGAILYGTTSYFLERLGLTSIDELPALAPFLPEVDALDDVASGVSSCARVRRGAPGAAARVDGPASLRVGGRGSDRRRHVVRHRGGRPSRPWPWTCTTPTACACRR